MKELFMAVLLSCLVMSCGGSDPAPSLSTSMDNEPCVTGLIQTCECKDGRVGTKACSMENRFGPCSCQSEPSCVPNLAVACECPDGSKTGIKTCGFEGKFGACMCSVGTGGSAGGLGDSGSGQDAGVDALQSEQDAGAEAQAEQDAAQDSPQAEQDSAPDSPTQLCQPGTKLTCDCQNGLKGDAFCNVAGDGYSECMCLPKATDAGQDSQVEQDSADSGSEAEVAVDLCQGMQCPLLTHCVSDGLSAECLVDDSPKAFDCPLPAIQPDAVTDSIIVQRRFLLPDDAVPNNNYYIGPFCCTGRTAILKNSVQKELGYAYFFSWEGQAVIIGETSFTTDVTLLVSGLLDLNYSVMPQNAIHLTAEELATCTSHWVRAGSFIVKAMPVHADVWRPSCLSKELAYDMGTLKLAIDVRWDGPVP